MEASVEHSAQFFLDPFGQLTSMLAVTALTFGLIEGGVQSFHAPLIQAAFGVALVCFVAFLFVEARGEVQSGKTLHHDLDSPGALRISEAADEPRCGRKAYLAIRVELNCLRCRATAVMSMQVPRAGLEATSFQHRPRAVWYSDQVQTVRPSNTAMATISMRNDARFDTDQTSTASRR